jgi:hypothetical protein
MKNKHDEIKDLLKASRNLLTNSLVKEETERIKQTYGMLTEDDTTKKYDVAKSVSDTIEDDENDEEKEERKQGYRISGGVLVLHGNEKTDLELTTDEKIAFQETMDEFVAEVSDLVDFNRLNVYPRNVEWSGKIIDFDIQFYYTIGEENGVYIEGDMIKTDEKFLEMVSKLKSYYEKFKSKWAKVLGSRKKTLANG